MSKLNHFAIPADLPERAIHDPGVAWFAFCQDSEGNSIPIYQPDLAAR